MNPAPLPTLPESSADPVDLHLVSDSDYAAWLAAQSEHCRQWLQRNVFRAERGRWLLVPGVAGAVQQVVAGVGGKADGQAWFWLAAALADRLPAADYRVATASVPLEIFALGWAIGGYRFARYRAPSNAGASSAARLLCPPAVDRNAIGIAARANALARDLINTPANDMGPQQLEQAAADLAARCGGRLTVTRDAELTRQFPLIAAVGQGSPRAPRLLDLHFPRPGAPKVTLVGKGVCFDTGGLDIKPSAGMLLMKKDMGGAACALATAQMVRELDIPIELRVLVPAAENSVDGASFRPGDVWRSRQGLSVEITNTDAEGRLVLADALTLASEGKPDLIIDFATLTGAARVALGAELPPVYSGDADLRQALVAQGEPVADPLWPMPLWDAYEDELSSRIADLNNAPAGGMAGSVTAALFLRRFVADPARWIHLDIYGWNAKDRPGRPLGAEAQAVRAVAAFLQQRYA